MAKKIYMGIGGVARTVKKLYVGVNGVARRVKKAYIGIANVARLFFSGGELVKVSSVTALSQKRTGLAGAHVGNYALFGGGSISAGSIYDLTYTFYATVDAYNTSLTRSTPTALSQARGTLAGTQVGNYALFGGGSSATRSGSNYNYTYYTTVDAYNTSLTRSTPTALSQKRYGLAGTHVGNYALFGGGLNSGNSYLATVDAYNTSLTRSTPTALSQARGTLAGTQVGNYALFGGGVSTSATVISTVDAYNTSLTKSTPTALSQQRQSLAGTQVGDYALFGGGISGLSYTSYDTVDAYNTSLTRSIPTALSIACNSLAGTQVGDYALFGGGGYITSGLMNNNYLATVNAYNTSLTRSTPTALSQARYSLAGTQVGNYALFGGGNIDLSTQYATVDAYTVD